MRDTTLTAMTMNLVGILHSRRGDIDRPDGLCDAIALRKAHQKLQRIDVGAHGQTRMKDR